MQQFVILTDSSCDLPAELAQQLQLEVVPLSVTVEEALIKTIWMAEKFLPRRFMTKFGKEKKFSLLQSISILL